MPHGAPTVARTATVATPTSRVALASRTERQSRTSSADARSGRATGAHVETAAPRRRQQVSAPRPTRRSLLNWTMSSRPLPRYRVQGKRKRIGRRRETRCSSLASASLRSAHTRAPRRDQLTSLVQSVLAPVAGPRALHVSCMRRVSYLDGSSRGSNFPARWPLCCAGPRGIESNRLALGACLRLVDTITRGESMRSVLMVLATAVSISLPACGVAQASITLFELPFPPWGR